MDKILYFDKTVDIKECLPLLKEQSCYNIFFCNSPQNMRKEMKIAVKENNLEYVKYLLDIGYADVNYGLKCASFAGNFELVDFFIVKGAQCYSAAIKNAAKGGHIELTRMFVKKYDLRYDALIGSAMVANTDIFFEFFKNISGYGLLMSAVRGGNQDIINIVENDNFNMEDGLCGASYGGHLHLVKHYIENKNAVNINRALYFAGKGGHMNIIQYLIDNGADAIRAVYGLSHGGHINLIEYFMKKNIRNCTYDECMAYAALGNKYDLIEHCIKNGARDFTRAITYAKTRKISKCYDIECYNIVNFLELQSINL